MKIVITGPAWESYANALRFLAGYLTDRELARWDAKLWDSIAELKKYPHLGAYEPYLEHLEQFFFECCTSQTAIALCGKWVRQR